MWGGISKKGATSTVIFTGTPTAIHYCTILDGHLLKEHSRTKTIDFNRITITNTSPIIQNITLLKTR